MKHVVGMDLIAYLVVPNVVCRNKFLMDTVIMNALTKLASMMELIVQANVHGSVLPV